MAKIFNFLPFVEMIAICNSLAFANSHDNSDIDFFIIGKKNRLWLDQLLSVAIIKFLNLRPKPNNTKNKICLHFFLSARIFSI